MSVSAVTDAKELLSWRQVKLLWILLAVVLVISALGYAKERWAFGLNMTESLPHWAFIVDSQHRPGRGDAAMFEVPDNPYYPDQPFVKRIAGIAGDRIENRDGEIFVAGRSIGIAKSHARDGRPLAAISDQIIPAGYVFMTGTHVDSYDSRYAEIGLVPLERVMGRAHPVL